MPGYTNLFFGTTDPLADGAADARAAVMTLWQNMRTILPLGLTLTVENAVALIEDTTGDQTDEINDPTPGAHAQPSGTGGFASPVGASVQWNTTTFRAGRRVKGRTYMVPLVTSAYDTAGNLTTAARDVIVTAANAYLAADGQPVVWARPVDGGPAGVAALITSHSVRDFAAVLRSRRD